MREDMMTAFWEAIQRPGGAVGRGPRRWYVEIHPQQFSGFVDLVTHPWIAGLCEAGSRPTATKLSRSGSTFLFRAPGTSPGIATSLPRPRPGMQRRITSLAFNLSGVDVTEDMGPFEVAPGTQWMDGRVWTHEMFPAQGYLAVFRRTGRAQIPPAWVTYPAARHSPSTAGTAHPVPDRPPRAGAGRRCARRGPRRPSRHDGNTGLPRRPAAIRPRASRAAGSSMNSSQSPRSTTLRAW